MAAQICYTKVMDIISPLLRDKGTSSVSEHAPRGMPTAPQSDVDHSLRYFFIFLILGGASAVWVSYGLSVFNGMPDGVRLTSLTLIGMVFLLVLIFQSVLIHSRILNVVLVVIEAALLPAFFYQSFTPWVAIAAIVFVLGWASGFSRSRAHLDNALRIHFWHYGTSILTAGITALALFLAVLYVGLYQREGGITFNAYKFVVSSATPGVQYVAPNFSPETKVSSFLENTITKYLKQQGEFIALPAAQQKAAVAEVGGGVLERLTSITKLALKPGESIIAYTFRWITQGIDALEQRGLGVVVVGGIFLTLYFGIRGAMFFLRWPILGIAMVAYLLLQATRVITIGAETRQKEVIVVK